MLRKITEKISPDLRRIIENTAWLFGEKVFQMGLGLLVGVWVARYLGPKRFGIINYAMAYVGLLEPLGRLGLDNIIVRDLARNPTYKDETLGTAFFLKLTATFINVILLISTIVFVKRDSPATQWAVAIFALGAVLNSFSVIEGWFQSQIEVKYVVWVRNAAYIFINIVKVILIQIGASLVAFVAALVFEQALAYVGMIFAYHGRRYSLKHWRFSFERARELLSESWPLIISGFVIFIYVQVDQLMLGSMVGEEAVGVYSAAVKVAVMWYFIPISIAQSFFPSIVQAREINRALYERRMQKLFNLMAILGYGVAIPMTFAAPFIIQILYGQNYQAAASMLAILVWSGIFASLGVARESWLTTEGLMKLSAVAATTGAVSNVILNFWLIPKYGGNGAAIATIISQICAVYFSSACCRETRSVFWQQTKAITLVGWFRS
jgi:O-antigen/teichoic acid export membrane protein